MNVLDASAKRHSLLKLFKGGEESLCIATLD
jgi:hypothetical protein